MRICLQRKRNDDILPFEKDYDTLHKQDEFFRSIMKNMSMVGINGNPLKIFLRAWERKHSLNSKN
jgi:hypothetical protein